ncbi:hypothetical protein HJD18_09405 [Thermoleophilia bacterium SCSIO 60948]|nr:hypothetical protein HJD18_09405 [Thermoleophilia bacterium SCSIO 60948]
MGGGTAVALKGTNTVDAGDIKDAKLVKVKPNPVGETSPCNEGRTGVFCGADSISGYRGWSNLGGETAPAGFWKNGFGEVHLSGAVKTSIASGGSRIFILPPAYRPPKQLQFVTISEPNPSCEEDCDRQAEVTIEPNGDVNMPQQDYAYYGMSLDGITFLAK